MAILKWLSFLILQTATVYAQSGSALQLVSGVGFRDRRLLGFEIPSNLRYDLPAAKILEASPGTGNVTRPTLVVHDTDADAAVRRRCAVARGTWCGDYLRQVRVASRPPPRGSLECPNACSGWGNCNHDTGTCECPAGRGGPDCGQEAKRPCAHAHRNISDPNNTVPASSVLPNGLDMGPTLRGWTASRCFGYCAEDIAACFCGEGRYRRIPAPPGSPPWTPPLQWGRTLADSCQPRTDSAGQVTFNPNGGATYEEIYGPEGWCNRLDSPKRCNCFLEVAEPCDGSVAMESTCANQCSGHGDCHFGFCRCQPGWYGQDCSRKKAGADLEPGLHESSRPWLRSVTVTPPAALPEPLLPTRPRPLIYVYDVPPQYTSHMLQYRLFGDACVWRRFYGSPQGSNHTAVTGATYGVETLLHELMLQSEHRTFDPAEADFFYVPLYVTCYFWPVMGFADHPWWYAPNGLRPMHGANMISELHSWLNSSFPWWGRRGGRDHIWLMAHDEGACWMPEEAYRNSIVLTHWGRTDAEHTSGTAYLQDNYTAGPDPVFNIWRGVDYRNRIRGHPCFDPKKDLVIPAFKAPGHYARSPLLGAPPLERDVLLFFRGDIGAARLDHYSRGIRQRLFKLSVDQDWYGQHRIVIGSGSMVPGEYSEQLARAKFCLVVPGDGWSPRAEDAILHGCVPVVVMDGVSAVWEGQLDWGAFSLRLRESALEALPGLLRGVAPEQLARMQRHIARVWHRFAYATGPLLRGRIADEIAHNAAKARERGLPPPPPEHPFQPASAFPHEDDAFSTIMQWLYHRIPDTRG